MTIFSLREQSETLSQNYRRLGLASRLNASAGGIEAPSSRTSTASKLSIQTATPTMIAPTEARVVRDPETGKILRVIHSGKRVNPLNDPLLTDSEAEEGDVDDEDEDEEWEGVEGEPTEASDIIKQLEEQAARQPEKRIRKQSQREQEWIERLTGKYGDDFGKMARDRKLNPMQQTAADIARRVAKWKSEG